MKMRRFTTTALAVVLSLSFASAPAMANPGNGNGNGQGNSGSNGHGNSGHSGKGQSANHGNSKNNDSVSKNKSNQKNVDDDVSVRISYDRARSLAKTYGLTGYASLPPGIAKNLARGKPLPPGIAKKYVPHDMLSQLPAYPGYEWRIAGEDLVLIALSTAIVTSIINGVFR